MNVEAITWHGKAFVSCMVAYVTLEFQESNFIFDPLMQEEINFLVKKKYFLMC